MEVAVGLHPPVRRDDRIVDGAGQLDRRHRFGVRQRGPHRAVHLRGAAQRIRILHPRERVLAARGPAADPRGTGQQPAQVRGGGLLPRMRAQRVQVLGEDVVGAQQPLDRQGRGQVGGGGEPAEVRSGQHQHAQHPVGAVDQGQALLFPQHQRLDAGVGQRLARRAQLAVGGTHLTLAHRGQGTVAQRRQVTGAAERTVFAHHRGEPGVQQRGVGVGDGRADPGAPGGHGVQPVEHQRPHHLPVHLAAGGRGVGPDQRALQRLALRHRDLPGGQGAEPGGDAVVRPLVVDQRLDHGTGGLHRGQRRRGQDHRTVVAGHGDDVGRCQRMRADLDRIRIRGAGGGYVHGAVHEAPLGRREQ